MPNNPTQNQRGNSELKPCPFCGGKPEIIRCKIYLDDALQVRCSECGTCQPKVFTDHLMYTNGKEMFYTEKMATEKIVSRWNKRSTNERN